MIRCDQKYHFFAPAERSGTVWEFSWSQVLEDLRREGRRMRVGTSPAEFKDLEPCEEHCGGTRGNSDGSELGEDCVRSSWKESGQMKQICPSASHEVESLWNILHVTDTIWRVFFVFNLCSKSNFSHQIEMWTEKISKGGGIRRAGDLHRLICPGSAPPAHLTIFQFSHEGISMASEAEAPYLLTWAFCSPLQLKTSLVPLSLPLVFQSSLCYGQRLPFPLDF